MNKALFKYCQDNFRGSGDQKLKITASLKRLHRDYAFGHIDDKFCYFNDKDKQLLIERVERDLGIHLFRSCYPKDKSRIDNANTKRNEKIGALAVSNNFVLLNSLSALWLNGDILENTPLSSLGHFIYAPEIESVEHQHIIMVENLAVMAQLAQLVIPPSLKEALWVYRGDVEKHKQIGHAHHFFRRFHKTNKLIFFSDFDPEGLKMAVTSGATHWLTLEQKEHLTIKLLGDEFEWFKQENAKKYLYEDAPLNKAIQTLFQTMNSNQKTLKQEHMIAHSLPLALYSLN